MEPASGEIMSQHQAFEFPLTDMVVLVTGAGSGIGRAAALMALRGGAKVAAIDIDRAALATLETEAGDLRSALLTDGMDVTSPEDVAAGLRRVEAGLGIVTGLICSAGVSIESPFLDITPDLWKRVVGLNLEGTFYISQAVTRAMVANKLPGSLITISSALGVSGRVNGAHYSASKAAVIGLTKSLALELAPHGIRVNCVAPGGVETPLMRRVLDSNPGARERGLAGIPLGRFGQPDDLAAMICFLLSTFSTWTTGQTFHVNGGSLRP